MPEHQLQHERRVADHLDIAADQAAEQRVRRQPREAEEDADHGAERDADNGDTQRVQQPDRQRVTIGVGGGVGDDALTDRDAGGAIEEGVAELQAARGHVGLRVRPEPPAERDDGDQQSDLDGKAAWPARHGDDAARGRHGDGGCGGAHASVPSWAAAAGGKGTGGAMRCRPPVRMAARCMGARPLGTSVDQRAGGAYSRPPRVQMLFMPRSRPSGVFTPRWRSKISP